jgi:hypothetical protein
LNLSPADFFEDELSKDNFLRPAISNLMGALDQPALDPSLYEHKRRLLTFLHKKFSIFDDNEMEIASSYSSAAAAAAAAGVEQGGGIGSSGIGAGGGALFDPYNLVEEDRPVFVSEEEILRVLGSASKEEELGATVGSSASASGFDSSASASAQLPGSEGSLLVSTADISYVQMSEPEEASPTSATSSFLQPGGAGLSLVDDLNLQQQGGNTAQPLLQQQQGEEKELTQSEIENAMFCWRYPNLYDAMCSSGFIEDLVMTAVRLLDEERDEHTHTGDDSGVQNITVTSSGRGTGTDRGTNGQSAAASKSITDGAIQLKAYPEKNRSSLARIEARNFLENEVSKRS